MPGVHDTVVQGAPGLQAVAVLVEDLASEFLEMNGTEFTSRLRLTPQEICENYAIAKKTLGEYQALAGKGGLNQLLGLMGHGPARQGLPGGVELDPRLLNDLRQEYFVNRHHEQAFSVAFPRAYDLLCTPRLIDHALSRHDRQGASEFGMTKTKYRNSYQQLVKALGG